MHADVGNKNKLRFIFNVILVSPNVATTLRGFLRNTAPQAGLHSAINGHNLMRQFEFFTFANEQAYYTFWGPMLFQSHPKKETVLVLGGNIHATARCLLVSVALIHGSYGKHVKTTTSRI